MIIPNNDLVYEKKLVLLGSSTVGKTSILNRLMRDSFTNETVNTIGSSVKTKDITVDNITVQLQIWDTGGHERFKSLTPMYFHDADACIIVYDITSQQSFQEAEYWLHDLNEKGPSNILIALAGNKLDLASLRAVSTVNGKGFAEKNCIPVFMETSAQSGENITELFTDVARNIVATQPAIRSRSNFPEEKEDKSCC